MLTRVPRRHRRASLTTSDIEQRTVVSGARHRPQSGRAHSREHDFRRRWAVSQASYRATSPWDRCAELGLNSAQSGALVRAIAASRSALRRARARVAIGSSREAFERQREAASESCHAPPQHDDCVRTHTHLRGRDSLCTTHANVKRWSNAAPHERGSDRGHHFPSRHRLRGRALSSSPGARRKQHGGGRASRLERHAGRHPRGQSHAMLGVPEQKRRIDVPAVELPFASHFHAVGSINGCA